MADNAQRDNAVDVGRTLRKRPPPLTKPSSPPKKQALTKKPSKAQCTTVPLNDSIPPMTLPPTALIPLSLQTAQFHAHRRLQAHSKPTATQEDQLALSTTSIESDDLEDLESMPILASLQTLLVAITARVKTVLPLISLCRLANTTAPESILQLNMRWRWHKPSVVLGRQRHTVSR
jgi:hypothetical protein